MRDDHVQRRFRSFGIPVHECSSLLTRFALAVRARTAFDTADFHPDMLTLFTSSLSNPADGAAIDGVLSKVFFAWSIKSEAELVGAGVVSGPTLQKMRSLFKVTDYSYPAEWFPSTRILKRKVFMHVGPTNSGKTHNALRALAAARTGCYAGPLRLLAHEIADRLNKGQIVPLGAEVTPEAEPDEQTNLDVGTGPVVTSSGDGRFARACNLVTGESRVIVDAAAGLLSCTVEMVNVARFYDVAVVDEIQMIADEARGAGWSVAVLGLRAKELHLCGEETAVPIIEAMLRDTGDELIINRYERLTPLVVADKSLEGDLSRVQPGDCIVTFQRSNIFALKNQVEAATGLRAAVVYGRLPPEVRNAQAALFNQPGSGYDVLIGSDAIGMGLNLKIKRMIFSAVSKWDGKKEVQLSISQMKQIAGRAGRFGLHGDANPGGVVTTLREEDLETLRKTMEKPVPPLPCAYVRSPPDTLVALYEQLPPGSRMSTLNAAVRTLTRFRRPYHIEDNHIAAIMLKLVDIASDFLPLHERLDVLEMPVPTRDERMVDFTRRLVQQFREEGKVDLRSLLHSTEMFDALSHVLTIMESGEQIRTPELHLNRLESLDKALCAYSWLCNRNNVVFPDRDLVGFLKDKSERAIAACLSAIGAARTSSLARPAHADEKTEARRTKTRERVEDRSRRVRPSIGDKSRMPDDGPRITLQRKSTIRDQSAASA
ncbi:P-loop containing nucleoside triphosphate hydrolase protein [Gloeophyllum trabeum ATCC 11539]|uniref:p-loop containing nucleoside triphosphate hydrolase protein n=1 Tax=Gloeophyllum trabeum (strain ATCC 11539 / FP-39264 / Madison 617) TaxID=670483 RepID=S7R8D5_GLOTA|nr:P-loop containing nucleoside triphosphate hydrolase protein [Gloeophyllum trabeum ATCC 11539]EPQ50585.1 P-loop containing nucleoside triphosphate hydrolase protein [Gloeophyllum trabeum ATCC 11539]